MQCYEVSDRRAGALSLLPFANLSLRQILHAFAAPTRFTFCTSNNEASFGEIHVSVGCELRRRRPHTTSLTQGHHIDVLDKFLRFAPRPENFLETLSAPQVNGCSGRAVIGRYRSEDNHPFDEEGRKIVRLHFTTGVG